MEFSQKQLERFGENSSPSGGQGDTLGDILGDILGDNFKNSPDGDCGLLLVPSREQGDTLGDILGEDQVPVRGDCRWGLRLGVIGSDQVLVRVKLGVIGSACWNVTGWRRLVCITFPPKLSIAPVSLSDCVREEGDLLGLPGIAPLKLSMRRMIDFVVCFAALTDPDLILVPTASEMLSDSMAL